MRQETICKICDIRRLHLVLKLCNALKIGKYPQKMEIVIVENVANTPGADHCPIGGSHVFSFGSPAFWGEGA